jgi:Fe-S-cluster containining protein
MSIAEVSEVARKLDRERARETSEKIEKEFSEFKENFKCERCGNCCKEGVGVALWPHEFIRLQKIEKHLLRHIFFINNWRVLKLPCVFYNQKKRKCKIYGQRPIACRMYPLGISPNGSTRISPNCPEGGKHASEE